MFKAGATWIRQCMVAFLLGTAALTSPVLVQARGDMATVLSPTQVIATADLPPQGLATYRRIRQGGPFPYDKDGTVFGNRERLLPAHKRGYYREYTVKMPGYRDRGPHRIICGGQRIQPDACYYTSDHYASFRRIVE